MHTAFLIIPFYTEGGQNMPPQNMPLLHKGYIKFKAIKKQEEISALPFFSLKAGHNFPFPLWNYAFLPSPILDRKKRPVSQEAESEHWDESL